ncbi:hypothetical protein GGH95_001132 [Coemansia sp. RSA 1836]|nr:hypothetical protein GGH95_001132 [Coemansia sp. RSA 1836]
MPAPGQIIYSFDLGEKTNTIGNQGAGYKRGFSLTSCDGSADYSHGSQPKKRQYECLHCEKTFSRPSSLDTHIRSHTGEKPHKCGFPGCGRGFSVQSNMRRHEKTHYYHPLPTRLCTAKLCQARLGEAMFCLFCANQAMPVEHQQFNSATMPSTPISGHLLGSPLACVPFNPEVCAPSSGGAQLPSFQSPNSVLPQLQNIGDYLVGGLGYGLPASLPAINLAPTIHIPPTLAREPLAIGSRGLAIGPSSLEVFERQQQLLESCAYWSSELHRRASAPAMPPSCAPDTWTTTGALPPTPASCLLSGSPLLVGTTPSAPCDFVDAGSIHNQQQQQQLMANVYMQNAMLSNNTMVGQAIMDELLSFRTN